MAVVEQEQLDLDELERMSTARVSSGGSDLYEEIACDTSEAVSFTWVEGLHPVECVDLERFNAKNSGVPGLKATWRAIAGPDAGKDLVDNLMLGGKGAARSRICFGAVGMWDRENDQPIGRYADLIGRRAWIEVETQESVWLNAEGQQKTTQKSVVTFAGYKPFDSLPLPEELAGLEEAFAEPEVAPAPEVKKPAPAGRKPSGPGTTPPWPQ